MSLVDKLIESFGGDLKNVSEEAKKSLTEMFDKILEDKVVERTSELSEGHTNALKQTEEAMLEEVGDFSKLMVERFKAKEQAFHEIISEYNQMVESEVVTISEEYKTFLTDASIKTIQEHQDKIEEIALTEAKTYKTEQEADLQNEVKSFRKNLLEKVDQYLETKIQENIPKSIMESAVEVAALKPLVEGVVKVMNSSYIDIDSSGMEAIKTAKRQNRSITESLNVKSKENMKLATKVVKLEKQVKISTLIESLPTSVKAKAKTMLESSNNVEKEWNNIKDSLITESVEKRTPVVKPSESKKQKLMEKVNHSETQELKGFEAEIAGYATSMKSIV